MSSWFHRTILALPLMVGFCLLPSVSVAQDDDSFEALYQKAGELSVSGNYVEASRTFEKLIDLSGGMETLFEDYGGAAGGVFFDYGMTLLPQGRFEEAREAFKTSVEAAEIAKRVETPIITANKRTNLSKFQLGFCEASLGNHEEAIRLYDEYLAGNPDPAELAQVRNSFKLRYGKSLMSLGRTEEGVASVQELFDNREEWDVQPPFLMQGVLELGTTWAEQAEAAKSDDVAVERIEDAAHTFLDKNGDFIHLSPFDQFRFGFVDRLRKLAFDSTRARMYSLALRYLSFVPTTAEIREDVELAVARLPIGAGVPSGYQQLLDQVEAREKAPVHPDFETLQLVAKCYQGMGNIRAPREVYWHLVEQFPDVDPKVRGEVLHEAARFSSLLGDYSAAQYFGEKFMKEMPEDNELRNNVSTFMLQSLFTSGNYDEVIRISERVRERYDPGSSERELADSLYPLALYTLKRHEDAAAPFEEYVKNYPEGANREIVMFHRSSNSLILGKMREAAEQCEDFLKAFPDSERFLDAALADLSIARFNLQDYPAAISAADRLKAARPDSFQLGRVMNIRGDAYTVMGSNLGKDQEEKKAEWHLAARDSYLAAVEAGKSAETKNAERADFHKETVSEGLWKSAEIYYDDGEIEKGLAQYDAFFPDYAGTYWEPQMSIFSLQHLEENGRGDEGLEQVEKVILFLGSKPSEQQDISLLRKAIGSYAEASVRIRGIEKTLATLNNFPGIDPANQALQTWLKIQQVIVLQESRKKMDKESPEYAKVESQIGAVFEDLRKFDIRKLSEFALQQVGLYFANSDNPFLGVPYFEELLARQNPEADQFKAPAEMELARIEMRAADPSKVQAARERLRRIIDKYKDNNLIPEAHLALAKLFIKNKEWKDAYEQLDTINKEKWMFKKERQKRAEAGFLLGTVLDEMDDPAGANKSYIAVIGAYPSYYDWITQAWEKYIPNSLADFEKMDTSTPESQAEKRARELSLYKLTRKYLYMWQDLTDEDVPSGALRRLRRDITQMKTDLNITPEEEQQILIELGIAEQK